jgi:hypothetical protein
VAVGQCVFRLADLETLALGADARVLFTQRRHRPLHARIGKRRVQAGQPLRRFGRDAKELAERVEWVLPRREIAELNTSIGVDAGKLARARHRDVKAAETIDQTALQRLLPGPDAAARDFTHLLAR